MSDLVERLRKALLAEETSRKFFQASFANEREELAEFRNAAADELALAQRWCAEGADEIERLREALRNKELDYMTGVDAGKHILKRHANLVGAETIERCAQVMDDLASRHKHPENVACYQHAAVAIRALKDEP